MAKQKICFLPIVASSIIGLGVGLLTGEILPYLIIGFGVGALILALTQKDALLKK